MKILITSDQYFRINGVTTLVKGICAQLASYHDIRVLTLSPTKKSYKNNNIYYIGSWEVPIGTEDRYTFKRKDVLIDELIAWKPDILHVQTEFSIYRLARKISKATQAPMINTVHTMYDCYLRLFLKNETICAYLTQSFVRKAYKYSRYITVPTKAIKERLDAFEMPCEIEILPSGIQLEMHEKKISAQEKNLLLESCGIDPHSFVLVTVARLGVEKNITELIEYMPLLRRRIPSAVLLIVGDGHYRKILQAQTAALGLCECVRFAGKIPAEKIWQYYQLGSVFVSSSTSEVQSLCNIEALANGVPLVCRVDTALEGLLIHGETGFMYTNESEFVFHIEQIEKISGLHLKLSEQAKSHALFYSSIRYTRRLEEIYNLFVKDGATPSTSEKRGHENIHRQQKTRP